MKILNNHNSGKIESISNSNSMDRLFSRQEINDIIKEFIKAYIRGQIVYYSGSNFIDVKKEDLLDTSSIKSNPVFQHVLKSTLDLHNLISICSGVIPSTDEQYQKAINELFKEILILRMLNGISGTFYSNDIESQFKLIINDLSEIKKDNEHYENRINKVLEYVERLDPSRGGN